MQSAAEEFFLSKYDETKKRSLPDDEENNSLLQSFIKKHKRGATSTVRYVWPQFHAFMCGLKNKSKDESIFDESSEYDRCEYYALGPLDFSAPHALIVGHPGSGKTSLIPTLFINDFFFNVEHADPNKEIYIVVYCPTATSQQTYKDWVQSASMLFPFVKIFLSEDYEMAEQYARHISQEKKNPTGGRKNKMNEEVPVFFIIDDLTNTDKESVSTRNEKLKTVKLLIEKEAKNLGMQIIFISHDLFEEKNIKDIRENVGWLFILKMKSKMIRNYLKNKTWDGPGLGFLKINSSVCVTPEGKLVELNPFQEEIEEKLLQNF